MIARLIAGGCDAVYDLRRVEYGQVFRHDAERLASSAFQITGVKVRAVVQLARSFHDQLPRFRVDAAFIIEHFADGSDGYAGAF